MSELNSQPTNQPTNQPMRPFSEKTCSKNAEEQSFSQRARALRRSYFKYRNAECALELGCLAPLQGALPDAYGRVRFGLELACWFRCRVPLPDAYGCVLWSLGAGAAAGRCRQRLGAQ